MLSEDESELSFKLIVNHIVDVSASHIHVALPSENGPVIVPLFSSGGGSTGAVSGKLSSGVIMESDLVGAFAGDMPGFVDALRGGEFYVNVHTAVNPPGEIRGQIGAVQD